MTFSEIVQLINSDSFAENELAPYTFMTSDASASRRYWTSQLDDSQDSTDVIDSSTAEFFNQLIELGDFFQVKATGTSGGMIHSVYYFSKWDIYIRFDAEHTSYDGYYVEHITQVFPKEVTEVQYFTASELSVEKI